MNILSTLSKSLNTVLNTVTFGGYNYLKEAIGFETNRNRTAMANINQGLAKANESFIKDFAIQPGTETYHNLSNSINQYKENARYYLQQKINNDVYFDIRDLYSSPPTLQTLSDK